MKLLWSLALLFALAYASDPNLEQEEVEAAAFLQSIEQPNIDWNYRLSEVAWAYATNITEENSNNESKLNAEHAVYQKAQAIQASKFNWRQFSNEDLKRQFKFLTDLGDEILPADKYDRLQEVLNKMKTNYATGKICDYHDQNKCDLNLEPEITEIFSKSRDPEELKYVWEQWRKVAGAPVRELYTEYVQLKNEASRLNNYTDTAASWLSAYDAEDFEEQIQNILDEVKPLYLQLHAYVRGRLRKQYSSKVVSQRGPIPAHLLGNNWAQTWEQILDIMKPYPEASDADITDELIKQNYTVVKLFELADDFFKSINLTGVPPSFWERSMLEKPADGREVVCHASAWDFSKDSDVRIKMCTRLDTSDFQTIHHEMGHIQYFLQYEHLPVIYREGANPGFHEAIGDTIAMSAMTAKHLRKLGLIKDDTRAVKDDMKDKINLLMATALDKIPILYYAFLLDKFRLSTFRGETKPENYNCHYWKLREDLQGLEPPVDRTEKDFDIAAKYHISADVEYNRYCVAHIIQFQFQRALCELAGEYVPNDENKILMDCDIYESANAGNALGDLLKLGRSKSWPYAMEALTGQPKMQASGITEYFKPLHDWLVTENQKNGEYIGWEPTKRKCTSTKEQKKSDE
uniref:Angiotensin-converting enzyme n=1 Tax=Xenopsylla cheopis TaxID=163159 RepID=A0A6M2E0U0_XENCH